MRFLHYAGDSMVVSYTVCEAVFEYAKALGTAGEYDVVRIPVLIDGEREFSNLLLGPASLLHCLPAPDSTVDLEDDELVAFMRRRSLELGPGQVTPGTVEPWTSSVEYDTV